MQSFKNFIHGEFASIGNEYSFSRKSPADEGDVIGEFHSGVSDIDIACESARGAFSFWKKTTLEERKHFLYRLSEEYKKNAAALAEIISRETGKPLWESKIEVDALSSKIKTTIELGASYIEPEAEIAVLADVNGQIFYRPKGVVAVIGPFNFPAHLPNGMFVPALLAGNTVIFKPSPHTPRTAHFLAEIISSIDLPPGVFQVVQGGAEAGAKLAAHEGVNAVLFTGSYSVGREIKLSTLDQPWKSISLEMGGKNLAIVWEDADLNLAVKECLIGAFQTTGQRCSSTSRIALHPKIQAEFLEKFIVATKAVRIGHWQEYIYMGPLITESARDKFLRISKNLSVDEFEILVEAEKLEINNFQGNYVSPRLVHAKKINNQNPYHGEEIFGPDLCFFTLDSQEPVEQIKNLVSLGGYGLTMSAFTMNRNFVRELQMECSVGNIHWNMATNWASAKLPFVGYGKSGNEKAAGIWMIRNCVDAAVFLEKKI